MAAAVTCEDHDVVLGVAARLAALDRLISERRTEDRLAVVAAVATMDKRLDGMNEFRNALSDAQAKMMPRTEVDRLVEAQRASLAAHVDADHRMHDDMRTVTAETQRLLAGAMTRSDYETRHRQLEERITANAAGLAVLNASLAGQQSGQSGEQKTLDRQRNLAAVVAGTVLWFIVVAITVYFGFRNGVK